MQNSSLGVEARRQQWKANDKVDVVDAIICRNAGRLEKIILMEL